MSSVERSARGGSPGWALLLAAAATVCSVLACSESGASSGTPAEIPAARSEGAKSEDALVDTFVDPFVDAAEQVGLVFVHDNGMAGAHHMAEISGSGVALFDYDRDGDLDVYLVQGGQLPGAADRDPERSRDRSRDRSSRDRLYRNDLIGGSGAAGAWRFVDVTAHSGDLGSGYGMAAAVGDYDNDGWQDLYVTALDDNQLLRNNGDGTFTDVTEAAGTVEARWSVPAAFVDFDGDGWLDLYVGGYLVYGAAPPMCRDSTGAPDYCGPERFGALPDRLFRNRGDGTFEDVTRRVGLVGNGPALGVISADLDQDGDLEIYVANDGRPNHLWERDTSGRLVDRALLAGCSINANGQAEASMGVDAGDFDGDGDFDLFMTHLVSETNTLYRNDGSGSFADVTASVQLSVPSRLRTSFGTAFFDYDRDGWLDLLVVGGAVRRIESLARAGDEFPFHEPNQLFRNQGGSSFVEVSMEAGQVFELSEVSRGAAFGDLDNDGDTDVVISNNNGPVRLLLNRLDLGSSQTAWLGVELMERVGPEEALRPAGIDGARVELEIGERSLLRRVAVNGSYASSSDPRIVFGLGEQAPDAATVAAAALEAIVTVTFSDGVTEAFTEGLALDRYNRLLRGEGTIVP